jgi:hypothetical protein
VTTELTWPAIRVVAGKDRVGADIVYLTGPEPDFRWPTFIDAVVGLAQDLDVRTVVGLGAFPAPTPHTRPVRLASTVPPQSAELAGRVGTVRGTLEVPAGVQAALEVSFGQRRGAGDRAVGPRPPLRVGHALPRSQRRPHRGPLRGDRHGARQLGRYAAGESSRRQVDELIGANPEHLEMVRRLEAALDSEEISRWASTWRCPAGTRSPPSSSSSSEAKATEVAGGPPRRARGASRCLVGVGHVLGIDREDRGAPAPARSLPPRWPTAPSGPIGPGRRPVGTVVPKPRERPGRPAGPLGHRAGGGSVEDRQLGDDLTHLIDGGGPGQLAQPQPGTRTCSAGRARRRGRAAGRSGCGPRR